MEFPNHFGEFKYCILVVFVECNHCIVNAPDEYWIINIINHSSEKFAHYTTDSIYSDSLDTFLFVRDPHSIRLSPMKSKSISYSEMIKENYRDRYVEQTALWRVDGWFVGVEIYFMFIEIITEQFSPNVLILGIAIF